MADSKMHVTLSTRFSGPWLEISKAYAVALTRQGCTVYNPNTDCEHKPGDSEAGKSNWLLSFRENGLRRSKATQGFVLQLQYRHDREKTDMQLAEEGMAFDFDRTGIPRIGVYVTDVQLELAHTSFATREISEAIALEISEAIALAQAQWKDGIKAEVQSAD